MIGSDINKVLVLENGFKSEIEDKVLRYLDSKELEWEHYDSRFSFWKENKVATYEFFANLADEKEMICATVFDGFQQLELFIELFYALKHKNFTFKIIFWGLEEELLDWYNSRESTITPKELDDRLCEDDLTIDETKLTYDKIYAFKAEMNEKLLEVLKAHTIISLEGRKECVLRTMDDIQHYFNEKNKR